MSRALRLGGAVMAVAAAITAAVLVVWVVSPRDQTAPLPGERALAEEIAARPAVAATAPAMPATVQVPALRIEAAVVSSAVTAGNVAVPSDPSVLGRAATSAPLCDQRGTTLLVGHVLNRNRRGALWTLAAAEKGMELRVNCPEGGSRTYRAAGPAKVMLKGTVPVSLAARDSGANRVVLVTCGGPVRSDGHYADNVVVIFESGR